VGDARWSRWPASCAAALAAALLLSAAAAAEDDRSYRYDYEDVFRPFFVLDPAEGVYRSARDGALSSAFPAAKAPGAFRVFIVGGSIARMDGGRGLREALERLLPGRAVEVLDCGMSGYDSPREELVLREVLDYAPDAVVLMTGHNESLSRPWVPRWRLLAARWARSLGLARVRPPEPRPAGAARREAVAARLGELKAAVRRMARASAARGVPLVVFLPPLNVRDRPTSSALPRAPSFRAGWLKALAGDCAGARRAWAAAPGVPASSASLASFFSARCLESEGKAAAADAAYARALALEEPLSGRCGPDCRAALVRAARDGGAAAADADAEFRAYAAPRAPGLDEFADSVHWRPSLNALATRAIVAGLRATPAGAAFARAEPPRPPRPARRRDAAEWDALLRSAAADQALRASDETSAVLLAALEYAAPRRRGALDAPELLARLERDSASKGAAWGMPALAVPRAAYERALAGALLALGRAAEARRAFDAAARAGARGDELLEERSAYWRRAGQAARAERLLAGVRRRRGVYESDGDAADVRELWCREPIPDAPARLTCARVELALGAADAAAAQAERVLSGAGAAAVRREAALVLQDAGRLDRALAELETLARRAPDDGGVLRDYGVALFRSGRRAEAVPVLARAASREKEPGGAALSYATALDAAGRREEARGVLAAALARAKGDDAARLAAALKELGPSP